MALKIWMKSPENIALYAKGSIEKDKEIFDIAFGNQCIITEIIPTGRPAIFVTIPDSNIILIEELTDDEMEKEIEENKKRQEEARRQMNSRLLTPQVTPVIPGQKRRPH